MLKYKEIASYILNVLFVCFKDIGYLEKKKHVYNAGKIKKGFSGGKY